MLWKAWFLAANRPQESFTGLINLDDDRPDGVDILLLYLYTLEAPDFEKPAGTHAVQRVLSAVIIRDKYQALVLKSAGQNYVLKRMRDCTLGWCNIQTSLRNQWIIFAWRIWSKEFPPADEMKAKLLEIMVGIAKYLIEEPAFQKLLRRDIDFSLEFVRAVVQKSSRM